MRFIIVLLFFITFSFGDVVKLGMDYDKYIKNNWFYNVNSNNITSFEDILKNSYINIIIMLFLTILMITTFIIMQRKNKTSNSIPKIIRKPFYLAKLDMSLKSSKLIEADILQRISFSFGMIHKLAAKNNNTVIVDFDPQYLRYYKADFDNISHLFYNLVDFFLNFVSNSNILIDFKQTKTIDDTTNLKVIFRINANISQTDDKIRNALLGQTKEMSYKKLALSAKIAKILNTKITYLNKTNETQFVFDLKLSSVLNKENISLLSKSKKQMSALVAEETPNAFYAIANWLRYYNVTIKPSHDWEIIKRHLSNKLFKPTFVFIQAKIIQRLPQRELKLLKEEKEKKDIIVVIISNNEKYDQITDDIGFDVFLLKRPFTQDDLLNILNRYEENISAMEIMRERGGVFGGDEGSLVTTL